MISRTMLWVAEKPKVQRFVSKSRLTRPMVERFVAGDQLDDAIRVIHALNEKNIGGILDLLGEGVTDPAGAQIAADDYLRAVKRVEETGIDTTISVKLTQLGLAFDKGACIDHLRRISAEAQAVGMSVEIDMEQSDYVSATLDVFQVLVTDFPDTRLALQAYLRRTPVDLEAMASLRPKIRLVKGAYAEPPELAFQKADEIDGQFRFLTEWLFARGTDPGLATHDMKLINFAREVALRLGTGIDSYEIQMLYGVRRELQEELAAKGHKVRVYVPYGSAWYPYLMRRIAERPANLRFTLRAMIRG